MTKPIDIPASSHASWLTPVFAAAGGLIAANLYYVQPLAGPISESLSMDARATGLLVTLTQLGYGAGLLAIVPLGDLLENRSLIIALTLSAALALLAAGLAPSAGLFLCASALIGLMSVAVQVLVPFAAHLAPEAARGRAVGNVMSGLFLGIMLARPAASFIAAAASWRTVFFAASGVMFLLAIALARLLPRRKPSAQMTYGALLESMLQLALATPVLQRRAAYQACLFGAFSLFWTAIPLLLAGPFHFTQNAIALFALAGAAGALAAPIAGHLADEGRSRVATGCAMIASLLALLVTLRAADGSAMSLVILVAAAVILDFAVTVNLVVGQRAIYALGTDNRSRLNGIYMATFFAGGALGSALGGWAYAHGGWLLTAFTGAAFPLAALALFSTQRQSAR